VADRAVGSSAGSLGRALSLGDATTWACGITSFEIKSKALWARACAARSKKVRYECVDAIGRWHGGCRERDHGRLNAEVPGRRPSGAGAARGELEDTNHADCGQRIPSSVARDGRRHHDAGQGGIVRGTRRAAPGALRDRHRLHRVFLHQRQFVDLGRNGDVSMPSSILVGFAVTSHADGTLNMSTFDNVTMP